MKTAQVKVMFVLPSFAGGGAERVALTLLRHLDRGHFEPSLVVLDGNGPLENLVPEDTPLSVLHKPRLRAALPALISTIRLQQPDVVFSTLGYVNLALLAVRTLLPRHTGIVVREANMPSLSLPATAHSLLHRLAYRLMYRRADAVICTSEQMQAELRQDFRVPSSRLFLMSNPVDEERIRQAAVPVVRFGGDGLRLVAAGRLTYQKGFDRLIDIMVHVDPRAHLTILGDGPDRKTLEAQALSLGLSDRVLFTGFCDNPWPYYAGADGVVMSSRWEGLPNVVLEALSCGAPVIATPESGGVADIAAAAQSGSVMMASIGPAFVEAIKKLIPQCETAVSLRPSLLPGFYRAGATVEVFQKIVSTSVRSSVGRNNI